MVYFITGGQRSGKSSYAQKRALTLSDNPVYLATSRLWDDDHKARIERHKSDRDSRWENVEEEKMVGELALQGKTVLMDCVTLWLTNFFMDNEQDIEQCLTEAKEQIRALIANTENLIIVSNELGMSMHAETAGGRNFTDLQGWMNQDIASISDEVNLMISGIPVKIK